MQPHHTPRNNHCLNHIPQGNMQAQSPFIHSEGACPAVIYQGPKHRRHGSQFAEKAPFGDAFLQGGKDQHYGSARTQKVHIYSVITDQCRSMMTRSEICQEVSIHRKLQVLPFSKSILFCLVMGFTSKVAGLFSHMQL